MDGTTLALLIILLIAVVFVAIVWAFVHFSHSPLAQSYMDARGQYRLAKAQKYGSADYMGSKYSSKYPKQRTRSP